MVTYIKQNTVHFLVVGLIATNGDFITSEVVTYEVRKSLDNSLVTSGTLTNIGDIYIDSITIVNTGEYYILYFSPINFENGLEHLIVQTVSLDDIKIDLDAFAIKLCKILGLVQHNFRITDQVYDSNGCLISAKISIYETASDTENQINPITTYTVTALYDLDDKLIDYKVIEN